MNVIPGTLAPVPIIPLNPTSVYDLISNQDFESLGAGYPSVFTGWTAQRSGTSNVTADTVNAVTGTYCCALTVDASSSFSGISWGSVLVIGRLYRLVLTAKCTLAGAALNIGRTATDTPLVLTTSYQTYVCFFRADSTTFTLKRGLGATGCTIYIDNLRP
jgi:hypothetical protein